MSKALGSTLGNYNILGRLSAGGMGEVYLAEDTKLNRKVALKVLPTEWGDDSERLERFQWEAKVLATLNHPNIVTIYAVEKHEGIHFFTMELVEGETLREAIPLGGISLDRFLELAVPLTDALAAAHQRGIIHRDIKPGNIMVRHDGRLKVLDFGLAKLEAGSADFGGHGDLDVPSREPQTEDGRLMGTVAYMSPEQMAGLPLDHRADLFTLGVVFYEMLTGARPFEGPQWADTISQRLEERPRVSPNAGLPERLEEIVQRCLERRPDKRYQTAVELREDLAELQLEVVSGSFSSTQIVRPQLRRSNRLLWGALVAVLLLFGGAAAFVVPRLQSPSQAGAEVSAQKRIVVLPFQNLGAPEDEYFAAGITEEITSRLATVSALRVISRTTVLQYDRQGKTAKQIGEDLGVDYLLEGTVLWNHGGNGKNRVRVIPKLIQASDDTQVWSERYDRVIDDIFAVQSEISNEVIRQLDIVILESERQRLAAAYTDNLEAYEAYVRGAGYSRRHDPTRENWELAADLLERAVQLDPRFALAHAELSRVHSFMYHQNIDVSADRLAQARAAADRALEIDPELGDGHRAMGYYYYWGYSDYDRALAAFDLAAQSLPNDSQLLEGIGYIRRRQGLFDDALANFEKAFELDPKSSWLAAEMAHTYTNLRRYELADQFYEKATQLAPDQPLSYQLRAANMLAWQGDVDRARGILDEMVGGEGSSATHYTRFKIEFLARNYADALRLLRRIKSDLIGLDAALFPTEMTEAFVKQILGKEEDARGLYEASKKVLEARVKDRPNDPRLRTTLGMTYAGLGMKDEAIREARKAIDLAPIEKDAFVGPDYLEYLAAIYTWVGETEQAIDLIEETLAIPSGLSVPLLRIHPRWDPLRGNPRFEALLVPSSATPVSK